VAAAFALWRINAPNLPIDDGQLGKAGLAVHDGLQAAEPGGSRGRGDRASITRGIVGAGLADGVEVIRRDAHPCADQGVAILSTSSAVVTQRSAPARGHVVALEEIAGETDAGGVGAAADKDLVVGVRGGGAGGDGALLLVFFLWVSRDGVVSPLVVMVVM
jgi:hypothetical protein